MGISNNTGKRIFEDTDNYVVFDFETTGVSFYNDEIIEIAAVRVRDGEIIDTYAQLVNPGRSIPDRATAVNGITDSMVADQPGLDEVLDSFLAFLGDDILIGHNIHTFDMKFLYRDIEKYKGSSLDNDYLDTLNMAKMLYPEMHHRTLSDMANRFDISTEGAHRALADVMMNQKIYEAMKHDKAVNNIPENKCPKCGNPLVKRNGFYGPFWGCGGYPTCRYTKNIIS